MKNTHIESKEIKSLIKNMPFHVWLLKKYAFEVLMATGLLMVLVLYILFVPVFKGYLPVYISFSGLSWFFLRRAIWNLNSDLTNSIEDLIKAIEKELKAMKK